MALYLKIDGYTGDVTSADFKGQIAVSSYSWGFSVPVNNDAGSASNRVSSAKASISDMHLVKEQDRTSSQFMLDSMAVKTIPTAILSVTRNREGGEEKYMEYTMTNCICTSYNSGASNTGDQPMENFALSFTKLEIAQYSVDATGTVQAPQRGTFDFATNKKV